MTAEGAVGAPTCSVWERYGAALVFVVESHVRFFFMFVVSNGKLFSLSLSLSLPLRVGSGQMMMCASQGCNC
jgi:hypothetical protein